MELKLRDKVALITGASGGIGRALSEAFANEGCNMVLHAHSNLERLKDWVGAQLWSDRAICVQADVRVVEQVNAAFDTAREHFGRIDICVANAGIWPQGDYGLHQLEEERVRSTVETCLLGSMWTARAFMANLAGEGPHPDGSGSSLVFIGSTAGRFGERGHSDYAAAKAGLFGLMQSLKNEIVELDPRGRVNLVEPGWTVTEMARPSMEVPGNITRCVRTMALRQIGKAEDVANTVLMLSSPVTARHLTGQTITVAGGMEGRLLWDREAVDEEAIREDSRPHS